MLIENIMRQIWATQYHHLNGEWPSAKDIEAVVVATKKKEAVA